MNRQDLSHFQIFWNAIFKHRSQDLLRCTTQLYSARAPLICRALPQLHYTYITHVHTISDWHARQDAVAIFGGLPIIIYLAIIIYQNTKVKFKDL